MVTTIDKYRRVPRILRLDVAGQPKSWISWQTAVRLYTRDLVRWSVGEFKIRIRGGFSRLHGRQTLVDVSSIIACEGRIVETKKTTPTLTNHALFARDYHTCMYCGIRQNLVNLTCDHLIPRSMGGQHVWNNVVTACKRCNQAKGNRRLEDCKQELIALPYTPNLAEYLTLINSGRILGDQMSFLETQFGSSRQCRNVSNRLTSIQAPML
ncbi:MAG: HNH endonuclease [Gammaproteobacteria bacterium]|nr:HNH endonuclease [Gammaproteobacteria bacterium]MDE0251718.1 HNH endonuclease [Gammaproteobacteria bacterium]MDE0403272.1 HNH endonuclease [Gammaproteobacteria bacterium]